MAVGEVSRSFSLALEAYAYIDLLPESVLTDMRKQKVSKELVALHIEKLFDVSVIHESMENYLRRVLFHQVFADIQV
jgi:hypothetical protein